MTTKKLQELKRLLPEQVSGKVKLPLEAPKFKEQPDLCMRWCKYAWWHKLHTSQEIMDQTGVPQVLFKRWLKGKNSKDPDGWIVQRRKAAEGAIQELALDEKQRVSSMIDSLINISGEFIENFQNNNARMDVEDFNVITGAMTKLFNIRQLMMGQPTGIEHKKLTWEMIKEKMHKADIIYE